MRRHTTCPDDDGTEIAELRHRLAQIAQRLTPCSAPDVEAGWNLCAHGLPWPCPVTEAAWISREVSAAPAVADPAPDTHWVTRPGGQSSNSSA